VNIKIYWTESFIVLAVLVGSFLGSIVYNGYTAAKTEKRIVALEGQVGSALKGTIYCLEELQKIQKEKVIQELIGGFDPWKLNLPLDYTFDPNALINFEIKEEEK